MNILITGGAGSVGRDLTDRLLKEGHKVKVLDKGAAAMAPFAGEGLELIPGRLEDFPDLEGVLKGVEVVIHLAWSFSDDPAVLAEGDLKGHARLLEACAVVKVSRLFYASTAVVYGKPLEVPITEESPCLVEEARKPFYAIAKQAAEKLCLAYGFTKALPATIFRFWWSFGEVIGGRHLRDMLSQARAGAPLVVPDRAGGSFLAHDDLAAALRGALNAPQSVGQVFNLATLYVQWREVAEMILAITGSSSRLEVVPPESWTGPKFLADQWDLSTAKAQRCFGYRSLFSPEEAKRRLSAAIRRCYEETLKA